MAQNKHRSEQADGASLTEALLKDTQRLLEQQFELFRHELRQEVDKAKGAAVSLGAGAALAALGGILCTQMAVHGVHRATGLPLWGCYGLVGGLLGTAGAQLLSSGVKEVSDIQLIPRQTAEALKENVATLGEAVASGVS